jgi:hypothetical protein
MTKIVHENTGYGVIDENLKFIIPPIFNNITIALSKQWLDDDEIFVIYDKKIKEYKTIIYNKLRQTYYFKSKFISNDYIKENCIKIYNVNFEIYDCEILNDVSTVNHYFYSDNGELIGNLNISIFSSYPIIFFNILIDYAKKKNRILKLNNICY